MKPPEVIVLEIATGHMVIVDISDGPVSIYARDGNNVITQLKALGTVSFPPTMFKGSKEERRVLRLATLNGSEV